jgi:inner membrane protein
MKWVSHIAIAGAMAAPFDPMAVPVAALGSTAPDWLEWVLAFVGHKVKHRTVTHYISVWLMLAAFGAFVWDYHGWIMWFSLGAASHWLCDSFTIQGVPVGWWSDRRVHMFGGRLRTGSAAEFVIVAAAVGLAAVVTWHTHDDTFIPFFYDWGGLYDHGIIDGSEWRINRFHFL